MTLACPRCGHPYCSRDPNNPEQHARYAAQACGEEPAARCSFCRDFDELLDRRRHSDMDVWCSTVLHKVSSIENLRYALHELRNTAFEEWLRAVDVEAMAEPRGDSHSLPHAAARAVLEWRGEEYPQRWNPNDLPRDEGAYQGGVDSATGDEVVVGRADVGEVVVFDPATLYFHAATWTGDTAAITVADMAPELHSAMWHRVPAEDHDDPYRPFGPEDDEDAE